VDPVSLRTKVGIHLLLESELSQSTSRNQKNVPTGHNVLERLNGTIRFIDFVEARYLDEPTNVMREKFVVHNPFCKFVPFV